MTIDLIWFNGWGFTNELWIPWQNAMAQLGRKVQVVSTMHPPSSDFNKAIDIWSKTLPKSNWVGGWSLGGQCAMAMAHHRWRMALDHKKIMHPRGLFGSQIDKRAGIIALNANPKFVRDALSDWPGMSPDILEQFQVRYAQNPLKTLKYFCKLCSMGIDDRQIIESRLHQHMDPDILGLTGLKWLATCDQRDILQEMQKAYAIDEAESDGGSVSRQPKAQGKVLSKGALHFIWHDQDALVPWQLTKTPLMQRGQITHHLTAGGHAQWLKNEDALVQYIDACLSST